MAVLLCGLLSGCETGDAFQGVVERFDPVSPQEAALMAFDPHDADNRRRAIALFSQAEYGGEEVYVDGVYRLHLTDEDATVVAAALAALGRHGSPGDGAAIARLLTHDEPIVRWEAARALQRIHHPPAASALVRATRYPRVETLTPAQIAQRISQGQVQPDGEEDPDVRQAAALALGQYRQPMVVDALIAALQDPSYSVVHAAMQSLQTLTGQSLGDDPVTWQAWVAQNPRQLFADGGRYTYQPWVKPPGLLNRLAFWQDEVPTPEATPRGLVRSD
jgi:HEAT repeat protein